MCVHVLEAFISVWPGENAQMSFLSKESAAWGLGGGVVGSENSLEQQEITQKHRGDQGEHSHAGSVTAAAETTKIRRVRRPHVSGRNEAERWRTNW